MLKQRLEQKLLQKLSPQQIQLMKLLQLPTVALEQRVKEELETNPALDEGISDESVENEEDSLEEEDTRTEAEKEIDVSEYMDDDDTPSYKLHTQNKGRDDDETAIPYAGGTTYQEMLSSQLQLLRLEDKISQLAKNLIGNLDDSGYLRRPLDAIVDDLAFSQNISTNKEELEKALHIIQQLEPAGTGARNLQECLLLQLDHKDQNKPSVQNAIGLLEKCFTEFTKKHYEKILKKLSISNEELKEAISEVLKLNPKPGNTMNESIATAQTIIPDYTLNIEGTEFTLSLNGRNAPQLNISRDYSDMLETYTNTKKKTKSQKDAVLFVKQKLDSAKWFIDAIKQRRHTLLDTMNAILGYQKEYFLEGDERKLEPMILKDIAEIVNLDISTVSRVVNSKYIKTPYGTFLLKTFFSESITNSDGKEVSTRQVKKVLEDIVAKEDKKKPITDGKLADELQEKGFNIARRTVAKYREQLDIPVGRLRKEL